MSAEATVATGTRSIDDLLGGLIPGDNVVWVGDSTDVWDVVEARFLSASAKRATDVVRRVFSGRHPPPTARWRRSSRRLQHARVIARQVLWRTRWRRIWSPTRGVLSWCQGSHNSPDGGAAQAVAFFARTCPTMLQTGAMTYLAVAVVDGRRRPRARAPGHPGDARSPWRPTPCRQGGVPTCHRGGLGPRRPPSLGQPPAQRQSERRPTRSGPRCRPPRPRSLPGAGRPGGRGDTECDLTGGVRCPRALPGHAHHDGRPTRHQSRPIGQLAAAAGLHARSSRPQPTRPRSKCDRPRRRRHGRSPAYFVLLDADDQGEPPIAHQGIELASPFRVAWYRSRPATTRRCPSCGRLAAHHVHVDHRVAQSPPRPRCVLLDPRATDHLVADIGEDCPPRSLGGGNGRAVGRAQASTGPVSSSCVRRLPPRLGATDRRATMSATGSTHSAPAGSTSPTSRPPGCATAWRERPSTPPGCRRSTTNYSPTPRSSRRARDPQRFSSNTPDASSTRPGRPWHTSMLAATDAREVRW